MIVRVEQFTSTVLALYQIVILRIIMFLAMEAPFLSLMIRAVWRTVTLPTTPLQWAVPFTSAVPTVLQNAVILWITMV